jgi:hypothetical protein
MIHSLPTWTMLVLCLLLMSSCLETQPVSPDRAIGVEVKLDDSLIPAVNDARIIVLPTGERVLVLTGSEGLAACCLLPPKSPSTPTAPPAAPPLTVEK